MSELISAFQTGSGLGCHALLWAYAKGGSAVSFEAAHARRNACTIVAAAEGAQSFWHRTSDRLAALLDFYEECRLLAEGDKSVAIPAPAALRMAESVLRALPDEFPTPEFALEPDGAIEMDWAAGRYRLFSLSVGPGSRLAYAWLDGSDKGHGVERFDGITLPTRIHDGIKTLVSNGHAGIRAA